MTGRRHLANRTTALIYILHNDTLHNFDNKTPDINTKTCSLSIVLTATDQKPQKKIIKKVILLSIVVDIQAM